MGNFLDELTTLLNRYSRENQSNTPDFILASYLMRCLYAYEEAVTQRDKFYGIELVPGKPKKNIDERPTGL
jgi:hypothetical protein